MKKHTIETKESFKKRVRPIDSPILEKIATYPQLNAGNCVMQAGSTFTMYSNGLWEFQATVWTTETHSGDTWEHFVNVFDSSNNFLWGTGNFYGPNHMNDDGTHYPFVVRGTFDPSKFDASSNTTAQGIC